MLNDEAVVNSITHLGDQLVLKREQATDEFTLTIIQAIQKGTPLSMRDEKWSLSKGWNFMLPCQGCQ